MASTRYASRYAPLIIMPASHVIVISMRRLSKLVARGPAWARQARHNGKVMQNIVTGANPALYVLVRGGILTHRQWRRAVMFMPSRTRHGISILRRN